MRHALPLIDHARLRLAGAEDEHRLDLIDSFGGDVTVFNFHRTKAYPEIVARVLTTESRVSLTVVGLSKSSGDALLNDFADVEELWV